MIAQILNEIHMSRGQLSVKLTHFLFRHLISVSPVAFQVDALMYLEPEISISTHVRYKGLYKLVLFQLKNQNADDTWEKAIF